jgi:hypothetical protein
MIDVRGKPRTVEIDRGRRFRQVTDRAKRSGRFHQGRSGNPGGRPKVLIQLQEAMGEARRVASNIAKLPTLMNEML